MKENWLDLTSRLSIPLFILAAVFLYYIGTPEVADPKQTFYLVLPVALIIVAIAVYLFFLELSLWRKSQKKEERRAESNNSVHTWKQFLETYKDMARLLVCVLGYIITLNFLSFIPATIIFLFVMFFVFQLRNKWLLITLPVAITLVIFFVFSGLLNVPLP